MSYVLIDCTNYRALARNDSYAALGNLAYIQYANVDTVVHPTNENRHYAQFSTDQLQSIYDGIIDDSAKRGVPFKTAGVPYNDQIAKVRAMIEAAPALALPNNIAARLEEQAQKIDKEDDRPYMINVAGNTPKRLHKWLAEPNRNRSRVARGTSEQFTRISTNQPDHVTHKTKPVEKPTFPLVMTKKANGVPYEDFIAQGWTDELLIRERYAYGKARPKLPPHERKRVRTPDERMTKKADGVPYADFIASGWKDEQLVAHGYMLAE